MNRTDRNTGLMSYRTSVIAEIFRKIGFYMQLNVLYHLKTPENCFGKKLVFWKTKLFGFTLAVKTLMFGFSMVDYLQSTVFQLENDF